MAAARSTDQIWPAMLASLTARSPAGSQARIFKFNSDTKVLRNISVTPGQVGRKLKSLLNRRQEIDAINVTSSCLHVFSRIKCSEWISLRRQNKT